MYRIWVEREGFETTEKKDIEIKSADKHDQAMVLDFEMKVAQEEDSAEKGLIEVRY